MNNETLPPPPPPPPPPAAGGVRGAGRERVPLQRAGRLFARTADRYGASDLFFSQQQQHQQEEQKTDNVPFTKAAASASNQPAAHVNETHMPDMNRAHEQISTKMKMHDQSIPTLAMHRIHREHEYKEPPQNAMVSQEQEKSIVAHHPELQEQQHQQEEQEKHEAQYSESGKAAVISRRQLSINESASPRPRTPLYDNSDMHFLPIQSHQPEQHKLNKQFYNLQDSTPELYQTKEVAPSHSAFASTPRVNLNIQEVEAKPNTRIPHTTRSDINIGRENRKMEISSAPLSAKSANAITTNTTTTLLRRDVPLFSRSRELAQNISKTPSNNLNDNNDTKVNAHMNVSHSGISSSRSTLRSSLPLHESTPTNAMTHRSNDNTITTTSSGGSSNTIKNDNADRVSSLTRHSLGLSLYSHNRGTPRREGLLEAALRRREENRLGHPITQTPLSHHLQDHNKMFRVNEKPTSNNNVNSNSAFLQKRSTDSPAIRTPISPFVKHIPANSNSSVVMTEKEQQQLEEEKGKHLEYQKEKKEQEQEEEKEVGSTKSKQNDATHTNFLEINKHGNEYVEPHNTRIVEDIDHNSNMVYNSGSNSNYYNIDERKVDYIKEKEGIQLLEQQLLPTNKKDNNNNVLAFVHRERAIINPFLSDDDNDDEDNESKKSNNNYSDNNVENDDEEATSNINKNVIGLHVSESDSEPLSQQKLQTNNNGTQWILNEHQLRNDKDDFSLDSHVHSMHNNQYNNNNNNVMLPLQHDNLQTKEEEEYPLPRVQVEEQVSKITKVASSSSSASSSSPSFASSSTESLFSDKRNHAEREKMYKFAQHSIVPVDAPDDNPFLQPHKIKKDNHIEDDNVRLTAHISNTLASEETIANHKEDHALHHVKLLQKEESPRMEPELQNKLEVNHTVTPENVFRLPHSHATKTILPHQQQPQQQKKPSHEDNNKTAFEETNNLEHDDLEGRLHNESTPNPFLSSTHNLLAKSSSAVNAAVVSSIAQRENDKMDEINKHVDEANVVHAITSAPTCEKQKVLYCPCFAVFIPTRGKFAVCHNMSSHTDKAQMSDNNNNTGKQNNMSGINTNAKVSNNVNAKPVEQSSSITSLSTSQFCDSYLYTCLSLHTVLSTPESTGNHIQITRHTRGNNYVKLLRAVATSPFFASVNKPPLNTESLVWAANLLQVDSNHAKVECGTKNNKNYNNNMNVNNTVENESNVEEYIPYSLRRVLLCLIEFAQQSESNERWFVWGRGGQKRLIECLINTENIISLHDSNSNNDESDDNDNCKDNYEESIDELKLTHSSKTIDLLVHASEQTSSQIASQRDYTAKNTTSAATNSVKDSNNALTIVEKLISVGKREEAVEMALKHHLYHHAILISMVCAHKDYYLQVVDAIVKEQLSQHSPLAHAYCLFNNRTMPPFSVKRDKDMTGDVQDDEIHKTKESIHCNDNNIKEKTSVMQTSEKAKIEHLLELQRTWRTHASVLISNFSPTSVAALLQLADELQQANLIMAAHTCLLLILLTPVMTSKTATITTTTGQSNKSSVSREGSSTVNYSSSSTMKGASESHSPMSRNEAAQQLVRRLGVLGGLYHPTQSCRANFLTPLSTILTDILQEVRVHLSLSVSSSTTTTTPLHKASPHDDVHRNDNTDIPKANSNSNSSNTVNLEKMNNAPGIPERSARFAINFHFMQVLWLYEVGMHHEASHALNTLLTILPASSVASEQHEIIPNTLNAFVYTVSKKYLVSKARNAVYLHESNDVINKSNDSNTNNNNKNNNINDNIKSKFDVQHNNVKEDEKPHLVENELSAQSKSYLNENNASSPLNISSTLPPEPSFNLPAQQGKAAFYNNNNAGPSLNTLKPTKTHEQRSLFNIPPPPPPSVSTQNVHEDTTQLPVKNASTENQTDSEVREGTNDSLSTLESKDNISNNNNSYSSNNNSSVDRSNSDNNNSNDNNVNSNYNKNNTRNANKRDKEDKENNSKNKALPPPPPRRSRSIDAIMRLFGRGKSEKPEDQAKPMILNSDKPPEFDEATGRWMFPETEEEKAERELIKRGPPKRPAPTSEAVHHANNLNCVMHENNTKLDRNDINNNINGDSGKGNELPQPPPLPSSHQTPTQTAKEIPQQPLPSPTPPQLPVGAQPNVAVSASGQRLFGAAPPVPVGRGHVLPARRGRGGSGALNRPQYVDLFN